MMMVTHPDALMNSVHQRQRELLDEAAAARRRPVRGRHRRWRH